VRQEMQANILRVTQCWIFDTNLSLRLLAGQPTGRGLKWASLLSMSGVQADSMFQNPATTHS
jgi:hypothetical protein